MSESCMDRDNEITAEQVEQGRRIDAEKGVAEDVHFHLEDAFKADLGLFDLVHWNNALHHMLDVHEAVAWSKDRLEPVGVFAMDDFVGASRFQWPERELEIARHVRSLLRSAFVNGFPPIERPTVEAMVAADPTEAADSNRILEALATHFPDAEIIPTGGVVYSLALTDVLSSFAEDETDTPLLHALLLTDEVLAKSGHTRSLVTRGPLSRRRRVPRRPDRERLRRRPLRAIRRP